MGEYVKYKGSPVKIGTCENLYYVSFDKYNDALQKGAIAHLAGNGFPSDYVNPDYGSRFRFPFPDETNLPFGRIIEPFDRGIPVRIDQNVLPDAAYPGPSYVINIMQQRLIPRRSDGKLCLALIFRGQDKEDYRVEDDAEIKKILKQIVKHHVVDNPDPKQKQFYRELALRIYKGYRLPQQDLELKQKPSVTIKPKKKFGKGL